MKKLPFLVLFIVIFVAVNIFLIEKKDNKIDRLHVLSNWETVEQDHLIQSFTSKGVVIPSKTHYFYVDKNAGFNQFLVKEGDSVEAGTPLFDYSTYNIETQKNLLDTEIDRLEKEISSIDSHIQNLSSLLSSAKADEKVEEDKKDKKTVSNPKTISYSIEMEINEKELEKEKLEGQIEQYKDQKNNYEDEAENLTIVSNTSGIVKKISYELNNPVITIVSNTPIIRGNLTEDQLSIVKHGMKTISTSHLFKGKINGVLEKVSTTPKEDPDVETKSFYPYEIKLDSFDQKLQEGYHVTSKVITKEVADATIIKKDSFIENKKQVYLWILQNGLVEKKPIKLGLLVKDKQQVNSGSRPGELYINNPDSIDQSGRFITLFNAGDISKRAVKKVGMKSTIKYLTIGILQR